MNQKIDTTRLDAWRGFITAHTQIVDAIDRELQKAGCVPLHWYDVLIELFEAPDHRLRMHELATKVVLSRSGLTRLVDRLEEANLLVRQPNPDDRRGAYAALTKEGEQALRTAWPVYAAAIMRYFGNFLSEPEAQVMADAFQRMLDTTK